MNPRAPAIRIRRRNNCVLNKAAAALLDPDGEGTLIAVIVKDGRLILKPVRVGGAVTVLKLGRRSNAPDCGGFIALAATLNKHFTSGLQDGSYVVRWDERLKAIVIGKEVKHSDLKKHVSQIELPVDDGVAVDGVSRPCNSLDELESGAKTARG